MSGITIYTVGSRAHGMGHVKRCLVLAQELSRRGFGVTFVTDRDTPGLNVLCAAGYTVYDYKPLDFSWTTLSWLYSNLLIDVEGDPSEQLLDTARPLFDKIIVVSAAGYAPQGV